MGLAFIWLVVRIALIRLSDRCIYHELEKTDILSMQENFCSRRSKTVHYKKKALHSFVFPEVTMML